MITVMSDLFNCPIFPELIQVCLKLSKVKL